MSAKSYLSGLTGWDRFSIIVTIFAPAPTVLSWEISLEIISRISQLRNAERSNRIIHRKDVFSLTMMKHTFRRVKEGSFRLGMNMILVGMALVPISHMAGDTPSVAHAEPQVWQTELTLADTQPALLIASDGVGIEKVTSRYQEVIQAAERIEAEKKAQAERERAEAQKRVVQVSNAVEVTTSVSSTCTSSVSDDEKWYWVNQAAAVYDISPKLLGAVWQIESGKRFCTTVTSYAGAQGPMQFMRGTWAKYAKDGNGDGASDINDARDALFAGAHLLAANGANRGDYRRALFAYNHADWYVNKVLAMAQL